jgi:hypothetical protein
MELQRKAKKKPPNHCEDKRIRDLEAEVKRLRLERKRLQLPKSPGCEDSG